MLKTLQAGRGLAAISVAAFHLSIIMGEPRYGGIAVFRDYTRLGNRGVDFFFILSGFIIMFAHGKDIGQPASWRHYACRRFVRLYPIYWLYTAVFVCLLLGLGGTDAKIPNNAADWLTSLTLIRFTGVAPPIPVAWTLFHELAFYIVFSVLILNRRAGIAAFGIFVLLPLLHGLTRDTNAAVWVYTSPFNWYFVLGMAAHHLYQRGGRGFLELGVGIPCFVCAIEKAPFPEELSPVLLALGFALMLAGATKVERAGYLHTPYLLALAGDASYTIYLMHSNLEGSLLKLAMKLRLGDRIGQNSSFLLVLSGTVVLGCLAYLWVERPLLEALRIRRRPAAADAAVAPT